MKQNSALLIFIKNPEKGKAKTRLAKTVGDDKALQIYQRLLQHTREISLSINTSRYLYYSRFIDQQDEWLVPDFTKMLQEGDRLGDRMKQAFTAAFKQHDKVIIIGSDCAQLSSQLIEQAFSALDHHPFVIGPAFDGGYYLLGMNQNTPSLFEDIEWSTNQVFPMTIQKIQALGASYIVLPTLSDIDTEKDWEQYGLGN